MASSVIGVGPFPYANSWCFSGPYKVSLPSTSMLAVDFPTIPFGYLSCYVSAPTVPYRSTSM